MTNAELLAYLQDYLHTNDTKTVANLQNFIALAANRVKTQVMGGLLEVHDTFMPLPSQSLPAGFISFRQINVDGVPLSWLPPDQYDLAVIASSFDPDTAKVPRWYTIKGGTLMISTDPTGKPATRTYYMLDASSPTALSAQIPSLLVRGAAYEAYLYEGDVESSQGELQGFERDLQFASDSQFRAQGAIAMGGV